MSAAASTILVLRSCERCWVLGGVVDDLTGILHPLSHRLMSGSCRAAVRLSERDLGVYFYSPPAPAPDIVSPRADTLPGDCKTFMLSYMKCLKANKSDSGECRLEARGYLQCRMDHGLMDQDDMQNLGLGDVGGDKGPAVAASTTQTGGAAASSDPAGTASKSADKTSRI